MRSLLGSPVRRLLLISCLSVLGYGCSSTAAPRDEAMAPLDSESGGADQAEPGVRHSEDSSRADPPAAAKTPTDLSPDPYRKVPRGEGPKGEGPKEQPPAAFTPPPAGSDPRSRPLRRPSRLAVSFVRKGHFVRAGADLLRLEASLADAPGLREIVGHPLPRGPARDLLALGREARVAGSDLLLIVSLPPEAGAPPGQAWLVHCQESEFAPSLLARFEPPTRDEPETAKDTAFTSDEPDSLAGLIAQIGWAHRALGRSKKR